VTRDIRQLQEEFGEARILEARVPKTEEIGYESKKTKEKNLKIEKIIEDVLRQTKSNIIVGQILELATYCKKKVMEAFLLKYKLEPKIHEANHVENQDYDMAMPVIAFRIKHFNIHNVLLDGGFGVNIITDKLCRKLEYNWIELAPFTIKMADQRKVSPLGIIRNLKFEIGRFTYNIMIIVIKVEPLGRPWLKQAKSQQDWVQVTLTIVSRNRKKKISTKKIPCPLLSKQSVHLECYD
jgi:hypothetical protein